MSLKALIALMVLALTTSATAAQETAGAEASRPILRLALGQHSTAIQRIAASDDGALIVTGGSDGAVRFWSADGEMLDRVYLPLGDGRTGQVTALTLSRSGRTAIAAARPLDAPAGAEAARLYIIGARGGDASGRQVLNELQVAYQAEDGLRQIGGAVEHIAMSPDGAYFGLSAGPWGWQVYSTTRGLIGGGLSTQDPVNWIEFAEDGVFALAFASGAVAFHRIDETGGAVEFARFEGDTPDPGALAFSPDGLELAIGSYSEPRVQILTLATLRVDRRLGVPGVFGGGNLASVAWSGEAGAEGWLYAGGTAQGFDGRPALLAWPGGRGEATMVETTRDAVNQLSPLPDGGALYAAADPAWGIIRASRRRAGPRDVIGALSVGQAGTVDLEARTSAPPATTDFRRTASGGLGVSPDGARVWVRPFDEGAPSISLDLATLTVRHGAEPDADMALSDGLSANGPDGAMLARVPPGGRDLLIAGAPARRADEAAVFSRGERILSLDLFRTGGGDVRIVAGTDFHVMLFDADGVELARTPVRAAAWSVLAARGAPVIAAALGDGTLRWFGLSEDGLLKLAAFFGHPDRRRWAAWTQDGFFAHSDFGGEGLVGYHLNAPVASGQARWVPFDGLYHLMYRPDLVQSALTDRARWPEIASGARIDAVLADSETLDAQVLSYCPAVSAPAAFRTVDATDAITRAGAFCRDVGAVTRGRSPGPGGRLGDAVPARTRSVELIVDLGLDLDRTVMIDVIANGANVGRHHLPETMAGGVVALTAPLTAEARTSVSLRLHRANGVYETTQRLFFRRETEAEAAAAPRTLHLFGVGVDRYAEAIGPLGRAVADARGVLGAIADGAGGLYDSVQAHPLLLDEAVTRDSVLAGLAAVAQTAQPTDSVIVYLAGHAIASLEDGYSFVTADVASASEISGRGVTADDLALALSRIGAAQMLLVLDTCYSDAFRLEAPSRLAHDIGRLTIAASTSYQEALDNPRGIDNGVLAHAILEGLSGRAAIDDVVNAVTLGEFVRGEVADIAASNGHRQQAILRSSGGELAAFPLAGF